MKKRIIITIIAVLIIGISYFGIEMFVFTKGVKNDINILEKENVELAEKETESLPEFSEDDCVFDSNTQTDDFLKKIPEFSDYVWDNETKKATIQLDNGNTLIVTRGGCVHFSFYGNLLLNKSEQNFNDENGIFNKALWIAERLFHKSDYELIRKSLNSKDYEIEKSESQYYLNFKSELYCDMTLVVENLKDQNLISIEIGFYQC